MENFKKVGQSSNQNIATFPLTSVLWDGSNNYQTIMITWGAIHPNIDFIYLLIWKGSLK
jgi:hypothetical protein